MFDGTGALRLTASKVYETLYQQWATDLSPRTARRYRYELERWSRLTGDPPIAVKSFRQAAVTLWTAADSRAGEILHGVGMPRVMNHYLDKLAIILWRSQQVLLPFWPVRNGPARRLQVLLESFGLMAVELDQGSVNQPAHGRVELQRLNAAFLPMACRVPQDGHKLIQSALWDWIGRAGDVHVYGEADV